MRIGVVLVTALVLSACRSNNSNGSGDVPNRVLKVVKPGPHASDVGEEPLIEFEADTLPSTVDRAGGFFLACTGGIEVRLTLEATLETGGSPRKGRLIAGTRLTPGLTCRVSTSDSRVTVAGGWFSVLGIPRVWSIMVISDPRGPKLAAEVLFTEPVDSEAAKAVDVLNLKRGDGATIPLLSTQYSLGRGGVNPTLSAAFQADQVFDLVELRGGVPPVRPGAMALPEVRKAAAAMIATDCGGGCRQWKWMEPEEL